MAKKEYRYFNPQDDKPLSNEEAEKRGFIIIEEGKTKYKYPKTGNFVGYDYAKKKKLIKPYTPIQFNIPPISTKNQNFDSKPTLIDKKSNSTDCYFLQTNKNWLQTYFTYGLIFPKNLDKHRVDSSNYLDDYLIFNLTRPEEEDVLLEILLTANEEKQLLHNHFLPFSLPVSRVKNIYTTKNTLQKIKSNADIFSDTFIPHHLYKSIEKISSKSFLESNFPDIPPNKELELQRKYMQKFDKTLGLLTYMKNTSIYFSDKTDNLSFYSKSYFNILYLINQAFKVESEPKPLWNSFLFDNNPKKIIDRVIHSLSQNRLVDKNLIKELLSDVPQDIRIIFNKFVFKDYKKEALKKFEDDKYWEYYLLTALYNYRKDTNINQVIVNVPNLFVEKFAEPVLALLGYHYGYAKLHKQEEIHIKDAFFKKILNGKQIIKYKFDDFLDYAIVESVYQFCFSGKSINNNLDYLSLNHLKKEKKIISIPKNYVEEKRCTQLGISIYEYINNQKVIAAEIKHNKEFIIDFVASLSKKGDLKQLKNIKIFIEKLKTSMNDTSTTKN